MHCSLDGGAPTQCESESIASHWRNLRQKGIGQRPLTGEEMVPASQLVEALKKIRELPEDDQQKRFARS